MKTLDHNNAETTEMDSAVETENDATDLTYSLMHCDLCGTELEFKQTVNRELKYVAENSCCPACRIQSKTRYFVLH